MSIITYNPETNLANIIECDMLKEPQVECTLIHRFTPQLYTRELLLLKGSFVIGHYHKHEHLNICTSGSLDLVHDDGTYTEVTAPFWGITPAGRKTAYINEDCVWLNIYSNPLDEQDIETLESIFLQKTDIFNECNNHQILLPSKERVEYLSGHNNLPWGGYKFQKYGIGIFATGNIAENEIVGKYDNTILERYIQHSENPNCVIEDNMIKAINTIKGNLGGYVGEELTIYRK